MNYKKHNPVRVYSTIRFFSALLFSVIVTVNLVYQATVVGLNPLSSLFWWVLCWRQFPLSFEIPTGIVADVYRSKPVMIGLLLIGLGFYNWKVCSPTFGAVLLAQVVWGNWFYFCEWCTRLGLKMKSERIKAGIVYSKGSQMSLVDLLIGIALSMVLASITYASP